MSNFCDKCLAQPCKCVKLCSKCGVEKNTTNFHKDSRRLDGLYSSCKECKSEYYNSNRDKINTRKKINRQNNLEKSREWEKLNRIKNKSAIRISHRNYRNKKYKTDILFRIKRVVNSAIRNTMKDLKQTKNRKTLSILGCSSEELKIYLESKFKDGMSWDNYGEWHIDHKIPLATAKTENDVYKLNHYTNLQPLWAIDNLKKGANLNWTKTN
jgi:hypothetical protein